MPQNTLYTNFLKRYYTSELHVFSHREHNNSWSPLVVPGGITVDFSIDNLIRIFNIKPIVSLNYIKQPKIRNRSYLINVVSSYYGTGITSLTVKETLQQENKRGLTVYEGILFACAYPDILNKHAIDCIDTLFGQECVPTIFQWKQKIHLSAISPYVADSMCAAPIVIHEEEVQ